jgi:hypothetical protein
LRKVRKTLMGEGIVQNSSIMICKYKKVSSFSIYQQWTGWERNQANKFIHNSLKISLKINLTREVKDSRMKTIKPWREKLKKTFYVHGLVQLISWKRLSNRFNAMLSKIPMLLFAEIEKSIQKFTWRPKRPWIVKAILSKRVMP